MIVWCAGYLALGHEKSEGGEVFPLAFQFELALPQKSETSRSANGAEYDSQGQALSAAKRVAPG